MTASFFTRYLASSLRGSTFNGDFVQWQDGRFASDRWGFDSPNLHSFDPWCNGSTGDFDSPCRGSSPCGSATFVLGAVRESFGVKVRDGFKNALTELLEVA